MPRPDYIISSINSSDDERVLRLRAEQLSWFTAAVIHKFYMADLGLTRIDTDPPPGDPRDIPWRVEKLRSAGLIQLAGLEYIGAFARDGSGGISEDVSALRALLVLCKPEGLCARGRHAPTQIAEWDVAEDDRGRGFGKALLQRADIHPADEVILDVARPNIAARGIYEHFGFAFDSSVPPMRHGIFDVEHLRMHAPGATFLANIGSN